MKAKTIKTALTGIVLLGLTLILVAIYLAVFANLHNEMGMRGIVIIASVAGAGLALLIPAKIFLTLWLMRREEN